MPTRCNSTIRARSGTSIRSGPSGNFRASGIIQVNCLIRGVKMATALIVLFHSSDFKSDSSSSSELPKACAQTESVVIARKVFRSSKISLSASIRLSFLSKRFIFPQIIDSAEVTAFLEKIELIAARRFR